MTISKLEQGSYGSTGKLTAQSKRTVEAEKAIGAVDVLRIIEEYDVKN